MRKTSDGSRTGLVGRFVRISENLDESCETSFSDTECCSAERCHCRTFVTDHDFSKHLSQNPTTISHYKTLSNAGVAAL